MHRLLERGTSIIEVPQWLHPNQIRAIEQTLVNIGAFEVFRRIARKMMEASVHRLQRWDGRIVQFVSGHHQKIDIAVAVEIAGGERPNQIHPNQIIRKFRAHACHQLVQDPRQFRIGDGWHFIHNPPFIIDSNES